MTMAKKQALIAETLPHRVERKLATRAGVTALSAQQEKVVAQSGHFAMGVIYGAGYGLAVYGINLAGLGPALVLTQEPWQEESAAVERRVMMHALFGLTTAATLKKTKSMLHHATD